MDKDRERERKREGQREKIDVESSEKKQRLPELWSVLAYTVSLPPTPKVSFVLVAQWHHRGLSHTSPSGGLVSGPIFTKITATVTSLGHPIIYRLTVDPLIQ